MTSLSWSLKYPTEEDSKLNLIDGMDNALSLVSQLGTDIFTVRKLGTVAWLKAYPPLMDANLSRFTIIAPIPDADTGQCSLSLESPACVNVVPP